jgi:hypothetical protein
MKDNTRKVIATLAVAIMLISAGCLGFGGGSDPAQENETPTNETPPQNDGENNTDGGDNVTPNGTLDDSMNVSEIIDRSRGDMTEASPYAYTMESTSTTQVSADTEFTITQERTHDATVNDVSEERYIEYDETITLSTSTNTTSNSGVYFETPNLNTVRSSDSSKWQYPGSNYGYADPYTIIRENMNSPTVSTESPDTIVISDTLDEIDSRGLFTNTRRILPVAEMNAQQTDVRVVIQNEENSTHVVESIEVTTTESGVINSTNGGQAGFETESTTTIDYTYDSVSPIETPDEFIESENSTN